MCQNKTSKTREDRRYSQFALDLGTFCRHIKDDEFVVVRLPIGELNVVINHWERSANNSANATGN